MRMYLLYYVRMLCMYVCMYLVHMCRATYIMYGCCKNNHLLSHSTLVALAGTLSCIYSPSDHYMVAAVQDVDPRHLSTSYRRIGCIILSHPSRAVHLSPGGMGEVDSMV